MTCYEKVCAALSKESPSFEDITLADANYAYEKARSFMYGARTPDEKTKHGKVLGDILRLKALKWSEKPPKEFFAHVRKVRTSVMRSPHEGLFGRFYLDCLEEQIAKLDGRSR
jgi:hypothetical protein